MAVIQTKTQTLLMKSFAIFPEDGPTRPDCVHEQCPSPPTASYTVAIRTHHTGKLYGVLS